MPEQQQVTISVRGEAREVIAPDRVELNCEISAIADGALVAREQVVRVRDEVLSALDGLGSVVARVDSRHEPLTHLAHALSTGEYFEHDPQGNGRRRDRASVSVVVSVRDFARLPSVLDALVGRDAVSVSSTWAVDEDNPAWARLRAESVTQAIARARDYAAALDGSLAAVSELADGGLLSAGSPERSFAVAAAAGRGYGGEQLWLDPVPQEIRTAVDARFVALVPPLPGS